MNLGGVGKPALRVFFLAYAVALLACGQGELPAPDPRPSAWPRLPEVQHPSLEGVESAARLALAGQHGALGALLSEASSDEEKLAGAFGLMGELYHAYELSRAADQCYSNAATLAPLDFRWPYLRGLLAIEAGHPQAATAYLERALEIQPGQPVALLHLGEAWLELGNEGGARESFSKALAKPPGEAEENSPYAAAAFYGLGRVAAFAEDPELAARAFEEALELQPEAGALHYPLAQAYRKSGNLQKAKDRLAGGGRGDISFPDSLADAVAELAVSSGALLGRGSKALVNGHLEEAENWYRKAIDANPRNTEARRNLAVALTRAGKNEEAQGVLEEALRISPAEPLLAFDLANARLATGKVEGAIQSFERALVAAPEFEAAHFNLANTFMQTQRWTQARRHLERLLELSPGDPRARYQLAMCLYQEGQREEGLSALKKVLDAEPQLTAARLSLASILAQNRDLVGARRQYQEILRLDSSPTNQAAAHAQLGLLAQIRGATAEAESQLLQALGLEPDNLEASLALTQLFLASSRSAQAISILEPLIAKNPRNPELRYRQVTTLISNGDHQAARTALETGLQALPQDLALIHTLARLLATSTLAEVRDGDRALLLARRVYAVERSLDHAETIAMAMAEQGDILGATAWQRGLLQQAQGMNDPRLTNRIAVNLRTYEAGQPVRMGGSRAER